MEHCLYCILESSNTLEPTQEGVENAFDKLCQDVLEKVLEG